MCVFLFDGTSFLDVLADFLGKADSVLNVIVDCRNLVLAVGDVRWKRQCCKCCQTLTRRTPKLVLPALAAMFDHQLLKLERKGQVQADNEASEDCYLRSRKQIIHSIMDPAVTNVTGR